MRGTVVCAVTDGDESADALELGAALSERLGLRLVLAHTVAGGPVANGGDEGGTPKAGREGGDWRASRRSTAWSSAPSGGSRLESLQGCSGRSRRRRRPT